MPESASKVYVAIGAKISASFKQATQVADARIEKLTKAVARANATSAKIDGYRAQAVATGKARRAWQQAHAEVTEYAQGLKKAEAVTARQKKKLEGLARAASKSKTAFEGSRDKMREMRAELRDAGVDVRKLGAEKKRLASEAERAAGKSKQLSAALVAGERAVKAAVEQRAQAEQRASAARERILARSRKATERHTNMVSRASDARGKFARAGTQLAAGAFAVGSLLRESTRFETAMLGVAKQMGGAKDANGEVKQSYVDMRQAIEDLADTVPQARTEVVALAEASLRGGLGRGFSNDADARRSVIGFTGEMVKLSAAIDGLEPGELGKSMSTIAAVFKLPIEKVSELGDSFNLLDNKTRASGRDIIATTNRIAGAASGIGLTAQQTAALAGTMLDLGETEETAATSLKKLLVELSTAGEKTSETFKNALKKIGVSGKQLQQDMATDAHSTMLDVLERIAKLKPVDRTGALYGLVGQRNVAQIGKLALGLDKLRENIGHTQSAEAKGSVNREFQAKIESTGARAAMARNQLQRLAGTLGDALAPAFLNLLADIKPIVASFTRWARENPKVVDSVFKIVASLAALRVALLATKAIGLTGASGVTGIVARRSAARAAATAAATSGGTAAAGVGASAAAGAAGARSAGFLARAGGILARVGGWATGLVPVIVGVVQAIGAAIAGVIGAITAPIAAVVAAVLAAVVAIGIGVYKYWEPIKAFFTGIFDGFINAIKRINLDRFPALQRRVQVFRDIFGRVWELAKTFGAWVGGVFTAAWSGIVDIVGSVWEWFSALLVPIDAASEATASAGEAGRSFGDTIVAAIELALGVVDKLLAALDFVIDKFESVTSAAAFVQEKTSAIGSSIGDTLSDWFGEDEDTKRANSLNAQSGALAVGVNQNQTNNINVNVQNGDPEQVKRGIVEAMAAERDRARSRGRASFVGSPAF